MKTACSYQNNERAATIFALREALEAKGLNFSTFARKYGYAPQYVNLTAWQWWGLERKPRGLKMRRILKALEHELTPEEDTTTHAE